MVKRKIRYDFAEVHLLIKKGANFTEIYDEFGYADESGLRKRYKRDLKKFKEGILYDQSDKDTVTDEETDEHIPRKYGQRSPRMYSSDLTPIEWIQYYCGYEWDNANTRENIEFLLDVYYGRKKGLIFKPRDSGKTWSSIGVICYLLAEERLPQLVVCPGYHHQLKIYNEIYRVTTSIRFRRDYGDIMGSTNKSLGQMELIDELQPQGYIDPIIQIVTRGANIIGSHQRVIWLEDIIQEEFKSAESNEALLKWYDRVLKRITDTIGGTGTRKGLNDFYSHLRSRGFYFLHRKAVKLLQGRWPNESDVIYEQDVQGDITYNIPTGIKIPAESEYEMLDRPGWKLEDLLLDRVLDLASFESEMQNNPLPETGAYFQKKWWNVVEPFDIESYPAYLAVDTALGKKDANDFSAFLLAIIANKHLYFVDLIMKKGMTFPEIIDQVIDFNMRYNIRTNFMHAKVREIWISQELERYLPNIKPIEEKIEKIMRIDALASPFRSGHISIFKSMTDIGKAYEQYISYDHKPSTSARKDDFLDVAATMFNELKYYLRGDADINYRAF